MGNRHLNIPEEIFPVGSPEFPGAYRDLEADITDPQALHPVPHWSNPVLRGLHTDPGVKTEGLEIPLLSRTYRRDQLPSPIPDIPGHVHSVIEQQEAEIVQWVQQLPPEETEINVSMGSKWEQHPADEIKDVLERAGIPTGPVRPLPARKRYSRMAVPLKPQ